MTTLRKKTVRGQITAITLAITAFLFLLIGLLQYTFMKQFLYSNKAEMLQAQIRAWPPDPLLLSGVHDSNNWLPLENKMPLRPIMFQPGMIVNVINADGNQKILSEHTSDSLPQISQQQYAHIFQQYDNNEEQEYYLFEDRDNNEYMVLFRELRSPRGENLMLQVSAELASLKRQLYTQLAIYSVIAIFALAAGSLLILLCLRRALRPLRNMIDAVEQTNAENLTEHLPAMQQHELNQLANAYNNMLSRLEAAFESERMSSERMRQFIADASHELRTPITSIYGFIEVLQRGALHQPSQLELSLKAMEQESLRMKSLVESLLQLAKLDDGCSKEKIEMEPCSLQVIIEEMLMQLKLMAGNRQICLNSNMTEHIHIMANRHSMQQVVLNLVSNAISHTDAQLGKIIISLSVSNHQFILAVSDNGTGIAKEHQQQVFERFYRIDKARTRVGGGAGLGLAITKAIVEQHRGQMSVESELGNGATFMIQFPLAEQEAEAVRL